MLNLELDYKPCEHLPPWYREVLDYQQMCQTEEQQFALLAEEINRVADNFFLQTMDLGTVQLWENVFHITANPSTESLQFRRERIINRISMRPPYTLGFLYQMLDRLIGEGQWTVEVDYPNYALYIEAGAEGQSYWQELTYTVNHIKPAHITYISRPLLRTGMLLNERIESVRYEWNYHMDGTWALGAEPFADEIGLEVLKTPNIQSIQPELINDVANFASGDVAYARLNGSVLVGTLTKTVTPSAAPGGAAALTVTYNVTPAMTDAITSVELMDSSGNALTRMSVYVPVTETVNLRHTILVQEGQLNANNNT